MKTVSAQCPRSKYTTFLKKRVDTSIYYLLVICGFFSSIFLKYGSIYNCAVIKCYNNKRKLDKWKEIECDIHAGITHGTLFLSQPFRLLCFPGPKLYQDRCERWTKLMRRTTVSNTKWHPKPSDRVCNDHFVDNEPTPEHPDPSLNLGYNIVQNSSRRELFWQPLAEKK